MHICEFSVYCQNIAKKYVFIVSTPVCLMQIFVFHYRLCYISGARSISNTKIGDQNDYMCNAKVIQVTDCNICLNKLLKSIMEYMLRDALNWRCIFFYARKVAKDIIKLCLYKNLMKNTFVYRS